MRLALYISLLFVFFSQQVQSQDIITDLSDRQVDIRYSFDGADLLLFGTVDLPESIETKSYDLAIVIKGPLEKINVRRKEKLGFIWINRDVHTYNEIPGFYMVASNKELRDIASEEELDKSGIGYHSLTIQDDKHDEHSRLFSDALVKGKEVEGLYGHNPKGISTVGGKLFRADFRLPANIPVGLFTISTYVFIDGKLAASHTREMDVEKKGFERAVYSFANDHPFSYGLTAVLIALFAGWGAGLIGRK